MLYTEELKTKLFKDKNSKKYTPASLYLGSKKTGGYSILEPSQKEIEIFNGYNDSAFIKINGESNQAGTPSPTTPSNINSPSNFDLITEGKNLFNKNDTNRIINGYKSTSIILSSLHRIVFIPCKPNTDYTISKILTSRFSVFTTIVLPASGVETITLLTINNATQLTVKTDATANYLGVYCYHGNLDVEITVEELLNSIQIEIGIFKTYYQSYQTKIINFPYTLNRFTDGTKDYIEIDNVNKTAKLYKFVGEFEFLEGGNYTLYTYNGLLGVYASSLLPERYTRVEGVCSHEKRIGVYYTTTGTYMWIGIGNTRVGWIGILDELNITTVAEFKTWLGQQTANGNTVKGIYKLITPTVTDLDYDEVTTYYPYTKIYTNATVQPTLDVKIRVQGENKSALDLTTTDAQISMGNDSALRLRNNFTVACFIKSTIIPTSNQYFLRRYNASINGRCWGMIRTSTRPSPQNKGLSILVSSNGTFANYVYGTGNIDTTDGNWHHMAFTYSDKTVKLYVDGILDVTELVSALTSNDLTDTASAFDSANSYNGLLDDIRYYNRVLTDDEILKLSKGIKVSDTNMVGHWKCNEGKGIMVQNETGIENTNGTLNAQAKWTNDTFYQ